MNLVTGSMLITFMRQCDYQNTTRGLSKEISHHYIIYLLRQWLRLLSTHPQYRRLPPIARQILRSKSAKFPILILASIGPSASLA